MTQKYHVRRAATGVLAAITILGLTACSKSSPTISAEATSPNRPAADGGTGGGGGGDSSSGDVTTTSAADSGGSSSNDGGSGGGGQAATPGAVTLVMLGDSLTAGEGEDPSVGYPGRLQKELDKLRPGSNVVNLGQSGWTSQDVIDGKDGQRGELPAAEEAIRDAKAAGMPVIATLLIGSNDLWYLYLDDQTTSSDREKADVDHYRGNIQKIVNTLKGAGAKVVLAINDDQSKRPVAADSSLRVNTFGGIEDSEVTAMSAQAKKYADAVKQVASADNIPVVDFLNEPLYTDRSLLADDGNHPNSKGYDKLAQEWLNTLKPLL